MKAIRSYYTKSRGELQEDGRKKVADVGKIREHFGVARMLFLFYNISETKRKQNQKKGVV
jgi:hypothetical protein